MHIRFSERKNVDLASLAFFLRRHATFSSAGEEQILTRASLGRNRYPPIDVDYTTVSSCTSNTVLYNSITVYPSFRNHGTKKMDASNIVVSIHFFG